MGRAGLKIALLLLGHLKHLRKSLSLSETLSPF